MFHGTFGYYAQGIDATTAILPDGWRDRLVRFETPSTNGVIAWCLEALGIGKNPQVCWLRGPG